MPHSMYRKSQYLERLSLWQLVRNKLFTQRIRCKRRSWPTSGRCWIGYVSWSQSSRPATTRRLWIAAWTRLWKWPQRWGDECGGIGSGRLAMCWSFGSGVGERRSGNSPVLLLGHLDTVWPLGTLSSMPFQVAKGRAWGPGVLDMKAGVAMGLTAVESLRELDALQRPVISLLNSDEEVGSTVSRDITEKLARECAAVFVLEPAQGLAGAYKTARKGVGNYSIRVQGVAAHSGVDFERGHSAIVEL